MDATPINFDSATPLGSLALPLPGDLPDVAVRKWIALHDAAAIVAALAGLAPEAPTAALTGFAAAIGQAPHWRRELAVQGIEDLAAIMEPGLSALIAVQAARGDAVAPAHALWLEFVAARDALLTLSLPYD
ncbi:hypothetical protein WG901_09520 [Novosphingobium sp. PS1R-30]|uniref:Uncharacterized protein n=1 Tax=Novosphingobium anseongense TaxID=3133436 RepID=A0ABU8RV33_9SPHN